jgi:hypothetical protein
VQPLSCGLQERLHTHGKNLSSPIEISLGASGTTFKFLFIQMERSQSSPIEIPFLLRTYVHFGFGPACLLNWAVWLQTVSHELEEEALRREREAEQHLKDLSAAAAAKEHKQTDELKAKDQQISDLQVMQCVIYVPRDLAKSLYCQQTPGCACCQA